MTADGADGIERREAPYTLSSPYDVHAPGGEADGSLLVALHGQGMSAQSFRRHVMPCVPDGRTALLPQAPLPFEVRREAGIRQGNGWYVYLGDEEGFLRWMDLTGEWVLGIVDTVVRERGLDPARVSLLGFSQGGYLAGYLGIRNAARFERLVVAGARIKHEVLADAARAAAGFPLLCVHGDEDPSVSVEAVRRSVDVVAAAGPDAVLQTYPAGHAVLKNPSCQAAVRAFLASG